MRQRKNFKSCGEKKKRLSDIQGNSTVGHRYHTATALLDASAPITKHKIIRFITDYDKTEYNQFQGNRCGKSHSMIKRKTGGSKSKGKTIGETGAHSTKSNKHKNLQLRMLFRGQNGNEQSRQPKVKGNTTHHPLLRYMNGKGKETVARSHATRMEKLEDLQKKIRKSTSKAKKQTHKHSTNKNLSLDLHNKEIGFGKNLQVQRETVQQETLKTIKISHSKQQQKNSCQEIDSLESSKGYGLTEEQEESFGDRFPYGFQKVKLLGRGGFSLVWLGRHIKSGKQFAIKQIITQSSHQTHIKEIWFGTNFFTLGGIPKPQFSQFEGIKNLARMYSYEINQADTWIFYQKCGQSLGSNLYDIKAEPIYGQQRLFKIFYKQFYQQMAEDPRLLKQLAIQVCKSLQVLNNCEIVHSDLKTENILIRYDKSQGGKIQLTEVKLIDYGSSFQFKNISQFSMATPEYMPPQILNYIIHENEGDYDPQLYLQVMENYKNPWVVDVFSLGCVLLEIVVGVPLWMSLPLLVPNKTATSYCQKEGLFAVKGRLFPEIIQKQYKVIANIDEILEKENYSKICLTAGLKKVIKGMLEIDFQKRISPTEAIQILLQQDF